MGGMEKIGKNSPKSNFHMGGQNRPPPTLPGNSKPPPFLGLKTVLCDACSVVHLVKLIGQSEYMVDWCLMILTRER